MTEYDQEEWVRLYRSAMLELKHAKMKGRIGEARIEIAARIGILVCTQKSVRRFRMP
jgi:hypothetical protein